MQINQPAAPVATAPKPVFWTVIGAAWKSLDKKGREMLTIAIGNKRSGVTQITLNENDRVFLRPNAKRPNMPKDPDYQVCVNPA